MKIQSVLFRLVLAPIQFIQRANALLEPLFPRYPEFLAILHDIGENCSAKEDHMFPAWRVFDSDLEFLLFNDRTALRLHTPGLEQKNLHLGARGRHLGLG